MVHIRNGTSLPESYDSETHDLKSSGQRIRWFPHILPAPSDLEGRSIAHKLVALGHWNDDVESHLFSFLDLQITSRGDEVITSNMDMLGTYEHSGAVTDIGIADLETSGEMLVAIASSTGTICLARLLLPRLPGTSPADIQILDFPSEEQRLTPWVHPHNGPVVSVDIHADSRLVLSAGADGSLCVLDPAAADPQSTPAFKPCNSPGYISFCNARWCDSQQIVSVTSSSTISLWDMRQAPLPVLQSPKSWGLTGPSSGYSDVQAHWLDVHPSRPNVCAVGCSGGVVSVWDLRMQAQPLACSMCGQGDVWEVKFDVSEASTSAVHSQSSVVPSVLAATEGGLLSQLSDCKPGMASSGAYHTTKPAVSTLGLQHSGTLVCGYGSVNSFDVQSGDHGMRDVVCVTDSQELIYIRGGPEK
ncbi:hypothetical protein CEUSTIGMA_g9200.t1 [Chlamydomonas eustigma]|uniref:Nucleoporin Nup43 n=1 Tax=Chlamydomonas eustigma TaxID=1157962 RepID=A0A250XFT0_9CHLO|nr:hypothetical protein CEUSTIGMA_g9200.t1 [Chlamydomonas eustigma]|eukprot:GAX81772.1 hypothetical protein CEUSTIGMA_g9200.t1 [Chlamydomonas eustigma]